MTSILHSRGAIGGWGEKGRAGSELGSGVTPDGRGDKGDCGGGEATRAPDQKAGEGTRPRAGAKEAEGGCWQSLRGSDHGAVPLGAPASLPSCQGQQLKKGAGRERQEAYEQKAFKWEKCTLVLSVRSLDSMSLFHQRPEVQQPNSQRAVPPATDALHLQVRVQEGPKEHT